MFPMTQIQRSVFGSIILALTMTFGSMAAHASLISWNVFATHAVGTTDFDITFFLDTADLPSMGTATVEFSSVDVIFSGGGTAFPTPQSFTYDNNQTGISTFALNTQLVPFNAPVNAAGQIVGLISGVQAGPGSANFCIARLSMGNNVPLGQVVSAIFFGCAGVGNAVTFIGDFEDDSTGWKTSAAVVSAVPLPAALPLFGSALAMLGIVGWRRKRRAAA